MRMFPILYTIFGEINKQSIKYHKINEEGKKDRSIHFAIKGVIFSLFFVLMFGLSLFAFKNSRTSDNPLLEMFLLIGASILAIAGLLLLIYALVAIINQFRLNRKIISFLSLAIFLAAFLVSFIFTTAI